MKKLNPRELTLKIWKANIRIISNANSRMAVWTPTNALLGIYTANTTDTYILKDLMAQSLTESIDEFSHRLGYTE